MGDTEFRALQSERLYQLRGNSAVGFGDDGLLWSLSAEQFDAS
jgi:hypothetical protein